MVEEENGEESRKTHTDGLQKEGETRDTKGEGKDTEAGDSLAEKQDILETSAKKSKGPGRGRGKKVAKDEEGEVKEKLGSNKPFREELFSPFFDRPARERKSIERFAASAEKEKVREIKIEKGTGIPLKDIPNVVYRISKRKSSDDSIILLHKLLYGKRAKAHLVKQNILQFSGYVWVINEDKEKAKTKERLEKCVKESLLQVCELLDLSLKSSSKKEDVIINLLGFLESPFKTRDELLEEKEQRLKGKKRKKTPIKRAGKSTPGQTPRKRRKSEGTSTKKHVALVDESVEEEREDSDNDEEDEPESKKIVVKKRSHKDSDDEDDKIRATYKKKAKTRSKKGINHKIESADAPSKDSEGSEDVKKKSPKKISSKSPSKSSKASVKSPGKLATKSETAKSKVFSRKKKNDDEKGEKVKVSSKETPLKGRPSRGRGKSNLEDKGKSRAKGKKADPSDEELRSAICDLLNDADFSTVTFTDVVKQLERKFDVDLTQKKAHVKVLIREEISKIAEEDDGEEDDNGGEDLGEKEESDTGDLADQASDD